MANPVALPGTVVSSGAAVSPGGAQGPQGIPWQGFMTKTAAYTLTTGDNGKYVIGSGGSWTLTLPAPAIGLAFQVRNDMGISGTTGTITISPTGGTIDGLASIPLLPGQDCTIITDGTNWRTFGLKREVILGTQNITSSTASATILLPTGYRLFELFFTGVIPAVDRDGLAFQVSFNGGSTWQTTAYFEGLIYNSSVTAVANVQNANVTKGSVSGTLNSGSLVSGQSILTLWPGTASLPVTYIMSGQADDSAIGDSTGRGGGRLTTAGIVNALKYFCSSGNIVNSFLTVKGVV